MPRPRGSGTGVLPRPSDASAPRQGTLGKRTVTREEMEQVGAQAELPDHQRTEGDEQQPLEGPSQASPAGQEGNAAEEHERPRQAVEEPWGGGWGGEPRGILAQGGKKIMEPVKGIGPGHQGAPPEYRRQNEEQGRRLKEDPGKHQKADDAGLKHEGGIFDVTRSGVRVLKAFLSDKVQPSL